MISKPGESLLIAEVTRCEQDEVAAAYRLSNPPRSALYDDYNRLAEAVINARARLRQARLALKRYRRVESRTGSGSSQPGSQYTDQIGQQGIPSENVSVARAGFFFAPLDQLDTLLKCDRGR